MAKGKRMRTQYIFYNAENHWSVRACVRAVLTATLFSQSALLSSSNFLMVENSAVISESEKLTEGGGKEGKERKKTQSIPQRC